MAAGWCSALSSRADSLFAPEFDKSLEPCAAYGGVTENFFILRVYSAKTEISKSQEL